MAPRSKAAIATYRAGTPESEDDLATAGAVQSFARNLVLNRVAKMPAAKATSKRKASTTKHSRQALTDKTNVQRHYDETNGEDMEEEDLPEKPKAKRAKTTTSKAATGVKKSRSAAATLTSDLPLSTIPETQPEPDELEDVEQSIESVDLPAPLAPRSTQRGLSASVQPLLPRPTARVGSAQPVEHARRERSGSINAVERRGGDAQLRRELTDMTKKYETMQMRYDTLEETGKTDANSNFEKLKRATDQKTKDANDLISALRKEIAELKKSTSSTSSETAGFQEQIATLTTAKEKLTAANEKITNTNTKLVAERDAFKAKAQASQNEAKALEAKLAAARQQLSNSVTESKAQEAAAKNQSRHNVGVAGSEALKEAKMKENLYADLTGIIIRTVKRKDGEDEYDCIQTGRNGTLHFHLSVGNDATTPHPKTPSGLSYEEAEFAYEPLLDEQRDRDLLDLLPDYLTEEICFPRHHAQKFFGKLLDSMTKHVVVAVEENEEEEE